MTNFKINDTVTWLQTFYWSDGQYTNRGIIVKLGETRMGSSKLKPTAKIQLLSPEYTKATGRKFTTISLDKLTLEKNNA